MSHISVSDAINVGVIGYESKNAVPSSVNTPLTKANEFNEIIIKVQFLLMQPCAGYLDHPFTKSVVVGRTISLCNPCTGYMGYPFQKGVMLMALTIPFSLLLTQQIGGEKISH